MSARLLVTGAGTGPAENLIRSLKASEPLPVVVGCHDDRFALRASAADARYLVPRPFDPAYPRALRRLIRRERIALAIPTSDAEVRRIGRARRALGCRVFLPRTPVIELCQDKYTLTRRLRARGVAAPLTYAVRRLADVPELFRRLRSAPVWCRIRSGHGGRGALLASTPRQVRAWIEYWASAHGVPAGAFTLAEYLPGRDFSCQSLWRDGTLILTKTFERLTPFEGTPGDSSVAALAKTVDEPRVAAVCAAAVRAVDRRASGVFCFDVREDARGVPSVTEINAGRFSLSTNLYDLVGKHNMAATYVRLALGQPVNVCDEYDAVEGYYMVRSPDTLASIFRADELGDVIRDARP